MVNFLTKPLYMITERLISRRDSINGFYKITIINKTNSSLWLAKNMHGDLYDIIPPGGQLRIRVPLMHKVEFYVYKSSTNLNITGLNYYAHKKFEGEDVWIIR